MNGCDLITLLKDKPGWLDWQSWLEENAEWDIASIVERVCHGGLKWGVLALEQYDAVERQAREQYDAVVVAAREQYNAAVRPAREQYYAVERQAREQYDAVVVAAREALVAAIEPRLRDMLGGEE